MMQARIQKWGNSLAIRIPKPFALEVGFELNSLVVVSISEGKLVLEPLKPSYSLEELLAQVSEDNLHRQVEAGLAVGNEAW